MNPSVHQVLSVAQAIREDIEEHLLPPEAGGSSGTDKVVYFSLVRGTRGYIEQIVHQINGAYANGWYDASAVMIRRLVETLIIEAFEAHGIATKIQNQKGEFFYLSDMIPACIGEASWNMGRNAKNALPKLKDVGDKSAHSRRFIAHRRDIDGLIPDLRVVVQELLYLSKLRV